MGFPGYYGTQGIFFEGLRYIPTGQNVGDHPGKRLPILLLKTNISECV